MNQGGGTMRRTSVIVVITAALTSAVTSITMSVAWGTSEASAARKDDIAARTRLPITVDTKVDCGVPRQGADWPNQDALEDSIRCLEDEIVNVNRFMRSFFRCTRITEVTRYGDDPRGGTFGYLWDNGDGTPVFLTTALNYTIDPTTDPFNYFMLWQDTEFCLS
jgi:hypothetical protein